MNLKHIKPGFTGMRSSIRGVYLIFLMVIFIFLLENLPFISFNRSTAFIYVVKPLLWCAVILTCWLMPRARPKGKLRLYGLMRWWTVYLGIAYIAFMILGGLMDGFGKSPYDLSPLGIIKNIFFLGTVLAGREFARAYLVNSLTKKRITFIIAFFSLFMTFLNLPFSRFIGLKNGFETVKYMGEYVFPELSQNIMATYIVYIGGPVLSIIYQGILQGFLWFCPILPNVKWITKALIGTLCPIFSMMFLQYVYKKGLDGLKKMDEDKENPIGWIVTGIISVSIVWFSIGVFPLKPSVIVTGSMMPLIKPGDVVLVSRVSSVDEIKKGDIIQYKSNSIFIFHRIIDIRKIDRQTRFQTKGDNNSSPDNELVKPEDIRGKVVNIIPKIGWPTLVFKSRNNIPRENVEF